MKYNIDFYSNQYGKQPIIDYLKDLQSKSVTSKNDRVRYKKIIEYFDVLTEYGTRAGEPYVKHIEDDIWELRPTNDRFFFFYWKDNIFMMLHHFIKKTQKTPPREIEQAKRNLADWLERSKEDL